MATNPYLVNEDDYEVDVRMTPQTKKFVKESMTAMRPSLSIYLPIYLVRFGNNPLYKRIMERNKFPNVDGPKEIFINNPVDGYQIPCWVFKPTDANDDAPIVVYFHGGGWTAMSRLSHYYPVASLASKTKMTFISVEYRLAPEHKYRTQLTDYRAVIEWVSNNKDQFSSKDAKLGVMGDSSGGHISALMAHLYREVLDFQALIYPTLDLANISTKSHQDYSHECYLLTPAIIKACIASYLEDPEMAAWPEVSPIYMSDFSNLPKCIIVAAEFDPLFDSNKTYHEKLIQGNSYSEFVVIRNTVHGWMINPLNLSEAFEECSNHIVRFLSDVNKDNSQF